VKHEKTNAVISDPGAESSNPFAKALSGENPVVLYVELAKAQPQNLV
jgi:hypothetical protein